MVRFVERVRRTVADSRPALTAGAILFFGVILYLALAGSYGQEIGPYVAAAAIAGATLFVIRRIEARRAAKEQAKTEPLAPRTPPPGSVPPSPASPGRRTVNSHRIVAVDYAYHILGGLCAPADMPPGAEGEWRSFRDRGLSRVPTPQELTDFFARYGMITPQRLQLIDDYRHYLDHHEHRRPEMWAQRRLWFSGPG